MKKGDIQKTNTRENEKGAAMVLVILVSFLLLVACAGLLLESSTNSANVTDAAAEQQAYYAAESGIQSALNVLRGNTQPLTASTESESEYWASSFNPLNLIETRASAQTSPSPTPAKIDFRKAVTKTTSNYANDPSNEPRLSRWLNYNYTSTGSSYPDRVKVGSGNDNGFSLSISDPDKTGNILAFRTDQPNQPGDLNVFYDKRDKKWKPSMTIGSGGNTVTFLYVPKVITHPNFLNVSSGSVNTDFGRFIVVVGGLGVTSSDFPSSEDIRFQVIVDMTAPHNYAREFRGWIKASTINSGSTVSFDFDSKVYDMMGSTITLTSDPLSVTANNIGTTINGNMTQTEPTRLIVKSTGYGPRGAKKQLETVVQKNFFNGMTVPSTLLLVGPAANPNNPSDTAVFEPGTSAAMEYSGKDVVSDMIIPPIGTTNDSNLENVLAKTCDCPPQPYNGHMTGTPSNVDAEMPFWLQSPKNLDSTLRSLKTVAASSGRLFTNGAQPTSFGDNLNSRGITYVEGNAELGNSSTGVSGGGILVVTGKLTLNGKFNFNGLIIVTGAEGITRQGSGTGFIQGNVVVAPYDPTTLNAGFLPPKYNLSGGGANDLVYNSSSVANGMIAVSNFVLGVVEK